jgi:hypothetical protein
MPDKQRLRSAKNSSLPLTSVIPDTDVFKQACRLLEEAVRVKSVMSELEERADAIREELAAVAAAYDLKGFRHGLAGFEYHGYTARKTLSKELLLAAGVSADVIAGAHVEGEPFLSCKLVVFDLE